jgi:hypothetical protein
MRSSKVYCLISLCSWFVIIFKFDIFSAVMNSARGRGWRRVVMVWQEVAVPMFYIVRQITTRNMPHSHAGYVRTSQPLVA